MKFRLISNWREAWKMISVQALLAIGGLQGIIAVLSPEALAASIPGTGVTWGALGTAMTVSAAVIGAVGRIIDQGMSTKT